MPTWKISKSYMNNFDSIDGHFVTNGEINDIPTPVQKLGVLRVKNYYVHEQKSSFPDTDYVDKSEKIIVEVDFKDELVELRKISFAREGKVGPNAKAYDTDYKHEDSFYFRNNTAAGAEFKKTFSSCSMPDYEMSELIERMKTNQGQFQELITTHNYLAPLFVKIFWGHMKESQEKKEAHTTQIK